MNQSMVQGSTREEKKLQKTTKLVRTRDKNYFFFNNINSNKEDTIQEFQNKYLKELSAIEYDCLCCQYLLTMQKNNSDEVNQYELLQSKIKRIKVLVQQLMKSRDDFENNYQYFGKLWFACKTKFQYLFFNLQSQKSRYSNYFSLLECNYYQELELISKQQRNHAYTSDFIKQRIVEQQEFEVNNEPFDYVIIKAIFKHFSQSQLNYKLLLIIFIIIKKNLDCWISLHQFKKISFILVQLLQIIDPEIVLQDLNQKIDPKSLEYKLMNAVTIIKNLIDLSYKISERLINKRSYLLGVKMYYFGLKYKMDLRILGMKIEIDRDCQYFILCCQYAQQFDDLNLNQYQYYQSIAYNQLQKYQALLIADSLIKSSPNSLKYHYIKGIFSNKIGIILFNQKLYGKAMEEFNFCLDLDKDNQKSLCQISRILFVQKEYDKFLIKINQILQKNKQYLILTYLKCKFFLFVAQIMFVQNDIIKCKQILQESVQLYPTFLNGYLLLNQIDLHQQNFSEHYGNLRCVSMLSSLLSFHYNLNVDAKHFYNYGLHLQDVEQKTELGIFYLFKSVKSNRFSIYKLFGQNRQYFSDFEFQQYQTSGIFILNIKVITELSKEDGAYEMVSMIEQILSVCNLFKINEAEFLKEQKKYLAAMILRKMLDSIKIEKLSVANKKILVDRFQINLKISYKNLAERQENSYDQFFDIYYQSSDTPFKQDIKESLSSIYYFARLDFDNKLFKQIKLQPNSLKIEFVDGYRLWYEHKFKEAEVYFKQLLPQHYNEIDIHLILANISQKLKKWQESIIQINQAINIDRTNQYSYLQKAYALKFLNMQNEILTTYDQGLKYCLQKDEIQLCKGNSLTQKAHFLYDTNKFEEVLDIIENKIDQRSSYQRLRPYTEFIYGMSHYLTNNKNKALIIFKKFLRDYQSFGEFIQQGIKVFSFKDLYSKRHHYQLPSSFIWIYQQYLINRRKYIQINDYKLLMKLKILSEIQHLTHYLFMFLLSDSFMIPKTDEFYHTPIFKYRNCYRYFIFFSSVSDLVYGLKIKFML